MADSSPPSGATIERDAHTQQFVTLHNKVVRDKRLHRAARGLLAEVLSLPSGKRITYDTLADNGPEGRDALRTMIRELEKYGYVDRTVSRDDKGRYWTRYVFRETPRNGSPVTEKPHWTSPAETTEAASSSPVHDQRGFSASENPSPKDFKEEELKDNKDGRDGSPGELAPDVADALSRMIIGEIRELTGSYITAEHAGRIGRQLLGKRETPPDNPLEWTRAVVRATTNPRSFLPTPTPEKFTAPAPVRPPRPESILAARAAIAHLTKRPPSPTGDPLRDLASEQLAELRAARKPSEEQEAAA